MFRSRACCVALGIVALWLIAPGPVVPAQSAGARRQAATAAQKKPGAFGQFLQQVVTQITTDKPNPTLKMTAGSTTLVTGQVVSVTSTWSQPVTNPLYTFNWDDGSSQSIQGSNSQQEHVYTKAGNFVVSVRATATFEDRSVPGASRITIHVALAPEIVPPVAAVVPGKVKHTPDATPQQLTPPPAVPQQVKPATVTLHANPKSNLQGRSIDFTVSIEPPARLETFHYYFGDGSDVAAANGIAHIYTHSSKYSAYVVTEPPSGAIAMRSATISILIRSTALPKLTLTASTAAPVKGKELGVSATLTPAESPVSYRFDWGDRSPVSIVDALGDGRHTYTSPGNYTVNVKADVVRNGKKLSITSKPMVLVVTNSFAATFAAIALAGLATLAGAGYFWLRPRVSGVYRLTRWDLPRISVAAAQHVAISFRLGERRPQHSIRIVK